MHVNFGKDASARSKGQDVSVAWDTDRTVNGHMLIVGMSGAGKTYTLRRVIRDAMRTARQPVRVHVFDVHGDIEIEGASSVLFSESTDYGINPLIVDSDRHAGGVRKRIQSFVSAINRTSTQLGSKQEAVLRNLLQDLYAANGFYIDRPESWRLDDGGQRRFPKKFPTLQDAQRFAFFKLKAMYLGSDEKGVQALENVNRVAATVHKKLGALRRENGNGDPEKAEKKDADLEKAIENARSEYDRYLNEIRSGKELDSAIRYNSRDVLQSVVERIENLNGVGIFKPTPPPFDPKAAIRRHDLRPLGMDERKLYTHFALEEIFRHAVAHGAVEGVREIIVLDEAHIHMADAEDNICSTIAKEGRKFGLALICASQAPTHFTEDFLSSVATKLVLGIDEMFWDQSVRKMRLTLEALKFIIPKKRALVQVKQSGEQRSDYRWIYLEAA